MWVALTVGSRRSKGGVAGAGGGAACAPEAKKAAADAAMAVAVRVRKSMADLRFGREPSTRGMPLVPPCTTCADSEAGRAGRGAVGAVAGDPLAGAAQLAEAAFGAGV